MHNGATPENSHLEAELHERLSTLIKGVQDLDRQAMAQAQARLDSLTKPQGSLGQLENIAVQLAGIYRNPWPEVKKKAVLLMAGDHGVVVERVSAFPQEVTPQMFYNILNGGAAINVLSRQAGAEVICSDIGVAFPLEPAQLMKRRVANGTKNMAKGPAMTRVEALKSILTGAEIAKEAIDSGVNLLCTGELGIGNTTPSTAIVAVYTELPVHEVVGRGTGLNDEGLERKTRVIEEAIRINRPDPSDPIDVLAKVGGLEIGAIAGSILQAAASGVPIIVDGHISTAGAIIAAKLCPQATAYMIPSHCSMEPGHIKALSLIGRKPLLNLDMRLGEGTGAVLCIHIVEASIRILKEMATFEEAAVSRKIE